MREMFLATTLILCDAAMNQAGVPGTRREPANAEPPHKYKTNGTRHHRSMDHGEVLWGCKNNEARYTVLGADLPVSDTDRS